MVHYYGAFSNRVRGTREKKDIPEFMLIAGKESNYGRTWRQLIWKIYEVDPLRCPECGGELTLVNIVTDKKQIRDILTGLQNHNRWIENTHSPP